MSSAQAEPLDLAQRLRGFGPLGILAMLVILAGNLLFLPLSAVLVLIWARLSRTPWRSLGFSAPRSWAATVALGVPLGVALKLVMKALVMPMLGAPAINETYHFLEGNRAALPAMLYAVVIGAGFGEETLFRGYFFERLEKLLGTSRAAVIATVAISTALFALAHIFVQGLPAVEQAAIVGLVVGAIYAKTRTLWLPMVLHAAFDVTAVVLIYWGWESAVASWIWG